MKRKVRSTARAKRSRKMAAPKPKPSTLEPTGDVLILPSLLHRADGSSVALLLRHGADPIALRALLQGDGKWTVPDPLDVAAPDDARQALALLRTEATTEVDRLIALLDMIEANADLEPDGTESDDDGDRDEPSLGSCEPTVGPLYETEAPYGYRRTAGSQEHWADGTRDEREGCEHDGRELDDEPEDGGDAEPAMGWRNEGPQIGSFDACTCAGGEDEPSLGSFDSMTDQTKSWRQHNGPSIARHSTDAEVDDSDRERDDEGVADADALAEVNGGVL